MKQKRAKSLAQLIAAGTAARAGAAEHAVSLALHVGTTTLIDADLVPLLAFRDSRNVANAELSRLRAALRLKTKATYEVLFHARDFLKRSLGKHHSSRWDGTGFYQSLRIPRTVVQLQHVAGILAAYLEANPALEVANVLSAGMVRDAAEELTAAANAVTVQKAVVGAELTQRRRKETALRKRLSWMVDELHRVLDPLDSRWTAFGFNQPAVKQKPPTPTEVTVTPLGTDHVTIEWPKTERAEYYRVWLRKKEADAEFQPVATPADPQFTLDLADAEREVAVSAVNSGGESGLSEVKGVSGRKAGLPVPAHSAVSQ